MAQIVLLKIAAMFLVILVGWEARRRGFLSPDFTATLSRLVVDIAFPALVFTQMLKSVDRATLREDWYTPLLCVLVVVVAYGVGLAVAPMCGGEPQRQRNTALFLIATPNWVFLPLPIAEALYGTAGVRSVLLYNVGAQLVLWSMGVWILHGQLRQAARQVATNVSLWATAAGVAVALVFPATHHLEGIQGATASVWELAGGAVVQALAMVGSLTVPLSLLSIGAQLGGLIVPLHRFPRPLWGVLAGRLLAGPLVTLGLWVTATRLGVVTSEVTRHVGFLVASMPVAISCSVIAERFEGDTALAAQGIFYSTLFSLVTVPGMFLLIQRFGW